MFSIKLNNRNKDTVLEFNLIRSQRRTVALVITPEATLEVRAPIRTPLNIIHEFIKKKQTWIQSKIQAKQKNSIQKVTKKFVNGETFLYLGNPYCLYFDDCRNITLSDRLQFPLHLAPIARKYLEAWYKKQAVKVITDRVNWYTQLIQDKSTGSGFMGRQEVDSPYQDQTKYTGKFSLKINALSGDDVGITINQVNYAKIKITSAKTRWGSCTSSGTLSFSWRLIMAPLEIIDYVVVHELTHLIEMNHSKKFWNNVEKILPNYTEKRRWLKTNGDTLIL